ncbi:siroheme synthase CysG [Dinoroseobacter sp. S375]|uniref:siroheme synthase CysG n=1 Tax=Dinoroseobacter sp. S375 TaxID=3415136 RepID=UPI003C7CC91D
MKTFPMFVRMRDRDVAILGGGEQAAQKCRLILKSEARVTLYWPELDPELAELAKSGRITWNRQIPSVAALEGVSLCFIATGCPGTDASLHGLAEAARVLVNVVDQPDLCEAYTPSIVDRDPVVVAIGTEGTAPVLARQIKSRMEELLEPGLGGLAALAGRLRPAAAARLQPRKRRDLWRWVFNGAPRAAHKSGAEREAARLIKDAIAQGGPPAADPGRIALVGAGPGGADLMTLRGVQRLQEADIIFYDRLVDPGVLELARRDAERVLVGKTPGAESWPQDRINQVMVQAAKEGKTVVRLKCGDPVVFGRLEEEVAAIKGAGLEVEIVPGITAASAASARLETGLTQRGEIDSVTFVSGQLREGDRSPDWGSHLKLGTAIAIYMGVGSAPEIRDNLLAHGHRDSCAVDVVASVGHASETCLQSTLGTLEDDLASAGISNPAILFVRNPKSEAAAAPGLRVAS